MVKITEGKLRVISILLLINMMLKNLIFHDTSEEGLSYKDNEIDSKT